MAAAMTDLARSMPGFVDSKTFTADDGERIANERRERLETALTEARTTQIQALHGYAVARARLERAVGQDVSQVAPTDRSQ